MAIDCLLSPFSTFVGRFLTWTITGKETAQRAEMKFLWQVAGYRLRAQKRDEDTRAELYE